MDRSERQEPGFNRLAAILSSFSEEKEAKRLLSVFLRYSPVSARDARWSRIVSVGNWRMKRFILNEPRSRIPLLCVIGAQFMQYLCGIGFRLSTGTAHVVGFDLVMASFFKLFAITVLMTCTARYYIQDEHVWHSYRSESADKYMLYVILMNGALLSAIIICIDFIDSENFNSIVAMGISRKNARIALFVTGLLAGLPFYKSMFPDISRAIESDAANHVSREAMPRVNKVFFLSLSKYSLIYLLPILIVHDLLALAPVVPGGTAYLAIAAFDSLILTLFCLVGGYLLFLAHRDAVAVIA